MASDKSGEHPLLSDPAYKAAFERWWASDYSVEGLKKKTANTPAGRGSLHAYWFDYGPTPPIVTFAGRDWTIFHLPMHDLDGNPSGKPRWIEQEVEAFYKQIFNREALGSHVYNASGAIDEGLKPRAYFDGVVFPERTNKRVCAESNICPSYANAIFAGDAQLGNLGHGNFADFSGTTFVKEAQFPARAFNGGATFDGALFRSRAVFQEATFGGPTTFCGAVFREAVFREARFLQRADFSRATFREDAIFLGGICQEVIFDGTHFQGRAIFRHRTFGGPLRASSPARFKYGATFRDCSFSDTVTVHADFEGAVDFSSATSGKFSSEVDFSDSRFMSELDFSGRTFQRATRFVACLFMRAPQFHGAQPYPSTTFSGSQFKATIGEPRTSTLPDGAFATWMFHNCPFIEWLPMLRQARYSRDASTKQLEDSYRTLRHLFENDGEQSGRFYALEMDTRRRRTDVSIVERWLLFFFWLTSGYGRYIGRALTVLLVAVGLVTLGMFIALSQLVWPDLPPKVGDLFAFVWRLFLLPAPYSGPETTKVYWVVAFVTKWPVIHVLLSGVCALITTGIVGVILVTLRRRFALR